VERRRLAGVALLIVSACGYGSGTILAKPVYAAGMDWLGVLAWRFLLGALLGWAWLGLSTAIGRPGLRAVRSLAKPQMLGALALGVLFTANSGTYYAGLETVPASLAGLIVYIYPVLVAVLSLRFGRPLPGARPWLALAIAFVGVVLAVGGIDARGAPPPLGLVEVILSPIIYAVWIILSLRLAGERPDRLGHEVNHAGSASDAAATTTVMMTATATVFVVMAALGGRPVNPADVPSAAWPGLLGVGFASTFLAIQAFYAGARRIGAAQAALVSTVEPVFIITLATLLLGERLTVVQLAGGALIIAGVLLAQTAREGTAEEPLRPIAADV
jgi:drug/metabolite transporter (DMT)-like permease